MITELGVFTAYVTEKLIRLADQIEDGDRMRGVTNADLTLDNLWTEFKKYVDECTDR